MNVKPCRDIVIIKQDIEKHESLILPTNTKLFSGVVVAAGDGLNSTTGKLIPMNVKVGDHVIFGEYKGQHIKYLDEEYIVMHDVDIDGVLEDE